MCETSSPTFEEELQKLQHAVSELERTDLTLEEAFRQLEIGFGSYKSCRRILDGARERVEILVQEFPAETQKWEPFVSQGSEERLSLKSKNDPTSTTSPSS